MKPFFKSVREKKVSMTDKYILGENHEAIACEDLMLWGIWMEYAHGRRIALTYLEDGTTVSTVFLGLDYNFSPEGKPILWETMVFGGEYAHEFDDRYESYEDAIKGHMQAIAAVLKAQEEKEEGEETTNDNS